MTKRKEEILNYLYIFRFLSRIQTQTLLGHKYPNRIIIWLNELTKDGYVRRYYDSKKVTISAIYSLGLKGRKYLKENKTEEINEELLNRVWRENKLSIQFREHCLFIADCYLSLLKSCEENSELKTLFEGVEITKKNLRKTNTKLPFFNFRPHYFNQYTSTLYPP